MTGWQSVHPPSSSLTELECPKAHQAGSGYGKKRRPIRLVLQGPQSAPETGCLLGIILPRRNGQEHTNHCQDNRSSEKAHSTEKHNPCFLVLTCAKVLLERGVNSLENQPDGSRRDS